MRCVGDDVYVKTWDSLVDEFGLDYRGDIFMNEWGFGFPSCMRIFCGRRFKVSRVLDERGAYELSGGYGVSEFAFTDGMLEM